MAFHYWLVLHPDVNRPIGGVKQMHRLAESISSCGRQATIIQDDHNFHPGWFSSNVDTISHRDWLAMRNRGSLSPSNVLIFPETYISSITNYANGLPSVVFNQNASYTFGLSSSRSILAPDRTLSLYSSSNIKHVLCVSQYDCDFLSRFIFPGTENVSCIINGLEDNLFLPISQKKKRIVYMPRKNTLDASVVHCLLRQISALADWSVVPITNKSHFEVIDLLRSSLLFLSFGHPEGFGLPVAEALASGCGVVGYSGLGGRELFDIGARHKIASEIQVGDWGAFVTKVVSFDTLLRQNPKLLFSRLLASSAFVRNAYSLEMMTKSVSKALDRIESSI